MSSFDPNPVFASLYQEQQVPCEAIQRFYQQKGVVPDAGSLRGRIYRWPVEEFGQKHVVECTSFFGFVKLAVQSTNKTHDVKPFWSKNLQVDQEGNITTESIFGKYGYTMKLPQNGSSG